MLYLDYKVFDDNGYPAIYLPTSNYARSNGSVRVHLLQAEKLLGRPLTKTEVIHHKDENKYNWNTNNLMVFKTLSDHTAFHKGCSAVLDLETNTYYCPEKNTTYHICMDCGKVIDKKSIRCCKCNQLFLHQRNRPSRDELKLLIRDNSFVAIGKIYSVSDNTVRKWCKSYNLPYCKQAIKDYLEQDWSSL